MKYVYTVEDVVKETGCCYMEFERYEDALDEVYKRLNDKCWTRREILKHHPYIKLCAARNTDYGLFEEIESETIYDYTMQNAVL